jgi:hypothetical protein
MHNIGVILRTKNLADQAGIERYLAPQHPPAAPSPSANLQAVPVSAVEEREGLGNNNTKQALAKWLIALRESMPKFLPDILPKLLPEVVPESLSEILPESLPKIRSKLLSREVNDEETCHATQWLARSGHG